MTELEHLTAFCSRLGAGAEQAERMAAQLSKRADQLMSERAVSRTEAMSYLLSLVAKGHGGEAPSGFEGSAPLSHS